MLIANPIYDVVFKRLMENDKVAKFFIGTLLEQNIESVEVKPQEYTYDATVDYNDPKVIEAIKARVTERISIRVYRLDFIATIRTETGERKKILIEIQKAQDVVDLMRFRNYLAEQYKKEDIIDEEKVVLPITTIYILGFKLPEILTACLKVERNYKDLIEKKIIDTRSDFVEKLTHDSFIVQVERITGRYQTKLDKLLSVFEQTNFLDDRKILKEFNHTADIEEVKLITDILHHSGADPQERKKIEDEQEAWRTFDVQTRDLRKKLEAQNKVIDEKEKIIDAQVKLNQEKDKIIEDLLRRLGEK